MPRSMEGAEWVHRDDQVVTELTAWAYAYGGGRDEHGIQITLQRDVPNPALPTVQVLRLPRPDAIELAAWILETYGYECSYRPDGGTPGEPAVIAATTP